jgi:hypothetical protein
MNAETGIRETVEEAASAEQTGERFEQPWDTCLRRKAEWIQRDREQHPCVYAPLHAETDGALRCESCGFLVPAGSLMETKPDKWGIPKAALGVSNVQDAHRTHAILAGK